MDIYIFGASRTIVFEARESLEELKDDWTLREKYALEYFEKTMNIQEYLEQI